MKIISQGPFLTWSAFRGVGYYCQTMNMLLPQASFKLFFSPFLSVVYCLEINLVLPDAAAFKLTRTFPVLTQNIQQ